MGINEPAAFGTPATGQADTALGGSDDDDLPLLVALSRLGDRDAMVTRLSSFVCCAQFAACPSPLAEESPCQVARAYDESFPFCHISYPPALSFSTFGFHLAGWPSSTSLLSFYN